MRLACLCLLLFAACKKAEKSPPAPVALPTEAGDAGVADATPTTSDAGAAQVVDQELIQLTAASVRVSSKVANPNIKPSHLVDKNLSTAWNSVTGELRGAWIEIHPIEGAVIHTVKLTAGFTAKGPKGEDWFTMNPRIRKMRVIADGLPQPDIYLDVNKRELQELEIIATESVRLEVAEFVEGTKKKWREISISELEAWGTTPPGWTSPKPLPSIEVEVGALPGPAAFDPCEGIDERQAEARAKGEEFRENCDGLGCDDHNYPPLCSLETAEVVGPPISPPWDSYIAWCESRDEIYGPSECNVRFAHRGDEMFVGHESEMGNPNLTLTFQMKDVIADSTGPELVIQMTIGSGEYTRVCRADSFKCSEEIEVPSGANLAKQAWVFK